jgi:hypothetical protein
MYTSFFSSLWWYDRCLQGSTLFYPLVIFGAFILGVIVFFIFLNIATHSIYPVVYGFYGMLIGLPVMFIFGLILGWFVIGCSDRTLWQPIEPAHRVHALLKINYAQTGTYPENQEGLAALGGKDYALVARTTQHVYVYDKNTNTYFWIIRPSAYYVVVFSSREDWKMYRIPGVFVKPTHFENISDYPRDFPALPK